MVTTRAPKNKGIVTRSGKGGRSLVSLPSQKGKSTQGTSGSKLAVEAKKDKSEAPAFKKSVDDKPSAKPVTDKAQVVKSAKVGTVKVRVWWPPTDNKRKSEYGGAYWPAQVLQKSDTIYTVEYDNGDVEKVHADNVFPSDVPVAFGREEKPLEAGEFVEIFNNSDSDPCAWFGLVKAKAKAGYLVEYPFHDTPAEVIAGKRLRRARVWESRSWHLVQPFQTWSAGEVTSPRELFLIKEKDLERYLEEGRKQEEANKKKKQTGKTRSVEGAEDQVKTKAGRKKRPADDNGDGREVKGIAAEDEQQEGSGAGERVIAQVEKNTKSSSSKKVERRPKVKKLKADAPETTSAPSAPSAPTTQVGPAATFSLDSNLAQVMAGVPRMTPGQGIVVYMQPGNQPGIYMGPPPLPMVAPPVTEAAKVEAVKDQKQLEEGKKKRRRDAHAPRKPLSSYNIFISQHRGAVVQRNPGLGLKDVNRVLAQMWREATAQDKEESERLAAAEKLRFEEELKKYELSHKDAEDDHSGEENGKTSKRKKKDKDAPKRCRTAYILFSTDYRKTLSKDVAFNTATNLCAEAWKVLSPQDKAKYELLAEEEKHRYLKDMEAYQAKKAELNAAKKMEEEAAAAVRKIVAEEVPAVAVPAPISEEQAIAMQQVAASVAAAAPQAVAMPLPSAAVPLPTAPAPVPNDLHEVLDQMDMRKAKSKLNKLYQPEAYDLLLDAWRADSSKVRDAVRAYRQHILPTGRKDWHSFMVAIFGKDVMKPLTRVTKEKRSTDQESEERGSEPATGPEEEQPQRQTLVQSSD